MEIVTLLDGVTGTATGTAKSMKKVMEEGNSDVRRYDFPIQISGITTATVIVQGSMDGTTYSPISGASWTADGCSTLNVPFPYIQGKCTAHTTGTITMTIGI